MQGRSDSPAIVEEEASLPREAAPANKKSNERLKCVIMSLSLLLLLGLAVFTRYRNILPTTIRPFDLKDRTLAHPQQDYTVNSSLNVAICVVTLVFTTAIWCIFEGNVLEEKRIKTMVKKKISPLFYIVYFISLGGCLMILLVYSIKCLTGRLRPYFIDACEPDQDMVDHLLSQGKSWVDEKLAEDICTNKDTLRYRWSFPSGHSAEAWYSMMVAIFIIKEIRVNFKLTGLNIMFLPVKALSQYTLYSFAIWVSITRTLDFHHFWWDVMAGSVLGWLTSVLVFHWLVKPHMKVLSSNNTNENHGMKFGHDNLNTSSGINIELDSISLIPDVENYFKTSSQNQSLTSIHLSPNPEN